MVVGEVTPRRSSCKEACSRMAALVLLLAVICFAVDTFGGHIGSLDLIALGLALFAASFLIGPARDLYRKHS